MAAPAFAAGSYLHQTAGYPRLTHVAVVRTHRLQLALERRGYPVRITPYHGYDDLAHLHLWRHRRWHWYTWSVQHPFSRAWLSDISCISDHEEYGLSGQNTVAGYFGLIDPPSGYIEPGPTIARTYGDSWLNVPLIAQERLVYSLYQQYGWAPWSTAGACGL